MAQTHQHGLAGMSVPQVIDHIWAWVSQRINSGQVNNIRMPVNLKAIIGQQGFDDLANRFKHLIQAPVSVIEDQGTGMVQIVPTCNPDGKAKISDAPGQKPVQAKKSKIPRPPNAFIIYRSIHHPLIKATNPDMHNNQISIVTGLQWRAESQATRDSFKHMADILKEQHHKDNPDYSYQPRKSADKKRRMTRKKAAALANIDGPMMLPISATRTSSTIATDSTETTSDLTTLPMMPDNMEHDNFDAPMLRTELETTPTGNITFTLGDETFEDQNLRELLTNYNQSLHSPDPVATISPAFIYSERSDEAQDDANWWGNCYDVPAVTAIEEKHMQLWQELFDADVHPLDNATESEREELYDRQTAYLRTAESQRWDKMWDNGTAVTTEDLHAL